ncbi:hypothetical protein RD055328_01490 [Companilactobacillus sp. RD055328]|uniref:hypothetical protein n=1 Tax=Companilactobacillus sp. RD055328 TaxID=2916634 RepID=UPI001FC8A79C|nr:hypothetical protein [Companilactobacillus sp. RD055328]GKQ42226.1 hypothetical protein RD055328_01490 [Companilactobacillus sp. RD055328]
MNIKNEISKAQTIEKLMIKSKKYYSEIPQRKRAKIFNDLIVEKKVEYISISMKLMINVSFIIISYPFKENIIFKKKTIDYPKEVEIFKQLVLKIDSLYNKQQFENESGFNFTYINNQFNYPSYSPGDYLEMLRLFDEVSIKLYGFSLYYLSGKLLNLTSEIVRDRNTGAVLGASKNIFREKDLKEMLSKELLSKEEYELVISRLFINDNEISDVVYPTDIPKRVSGKLGVKMGKNFYIPQSYFVFDSLLNEILASNEINKIKGEILEKNAEEILKNFFGKKNVVRTYYEKNGTEHDILVQYKKYVFIIECKAQKFKEVFRDKSLSDIRLQGEFDNVIKKACEQCDRIDKQIISNDLISFYDSDKKNKKETVKIFGKNKKVFKIGLTLNDYLNLAESPSEFLKEQHSDTWIVNMSALKRILWGCSGDIDEFIKYMNYRLSHYNVISSISSDELEHFGYFKSNNRLDLPPDMDIGINISLGPSYARFFDDYDDYSSSLEIKNQKKYYNDNEFY